MLDINIICVMHENIPAYRSYSRCYTGIFRVSLLLYVNAIQLLNLDHYVRIASIFTYLIQVDPVSVRIQVLRNRNHPMVNPSKQTTWYKLTYEL